MEGSASNQLIEEINRLHSEYEKEIEKLKEKGILSDSTADGFTFHSRNFVRWCKDGYSPVSIGEISKVSSGGVKEKRVQVDDDLLEKEHKVAYYFSRFEHDILYPQYTQAQAFEKASEILGVKKNTLKHKRDAFDPYIKDLNKRAGWWQAGKLSDAMEKVYDRYLHMGEKEIEKEIREILGVSL